MTNENPMEDRFAIRRAGISELDAVRRLITRSVDALLPAYYAPRQMAAVRALTRIEPWLLEDGTYYVAECGGRLAASGGWSFRQIGETAMDDAGRCCRTAFVRAVFVDPDFARRGLGSAMLANAEMQAARRGYGQAELVATLGGVPLYRAAGWTAVAEMALNGPRGIAVPAVLMRKGLRRQASGIRRLGRAA